MRRFAILAVLTAALGAGGVYAALSGTGSAEVHGLTEQSDRASPSPEKDGECQARSPTGAEVQSQGFYAGCLPTGYELAQQGYEHEVPRAVGETKRERFVYVRDEDRSTRIAVTTVTVEESSKMFRRVPQDLGIEEVRVRGHRGLRQEGAGFVALRWAEGDDVIVDVSVNGGGSPGRARAIAQEVRR